MKFDIMKLFKFVKSKNNVRTKTGNALDQARPL